MSERDDEHGPVTLHAEDLDHFRVPAALRAREVSALRAALERILYAHEPDFAFDHDDAIRHGHTVLNAMVRRRAPEPTPDLTHRPGRAL